MKKVLVTGANGQLGKCINDVAKNFPQLDFTFAQKTALNLDQPTSIRAFFREAEFDFCINTAAYTNVEKAESEHEAAFQTNAEGVKELAQVCANTATVLIHVSTDYVFDGNKTTPYHETDITNPINVYGASKLKGEQYIQQICTAYYIFRTSWLYSLYGHNFLNSMRKFSKEKEELAITTQQTGTPTNANDLANFLLKIINLDSNHFGLYHFSNGGNATWYDFAKEILTITGEIRNVNLVKTDYYRTFAARPIYSVLNNSLISKRFDYSTIPWKESLSFLLKEQL